MCYYNLEQAWPQITYYQDMPIFDGVDNTLKYILPLKQMLKKVCQLHEILCTDVKNVSITWHPSIKPVNLYS